MASDWMRDALSKMFNEMDEITFDHESVCKGFLEDVCLAELFINTKLDRGDCKRTHSDKLKENYDLVKSEYTPPVIKVLNDLERELDNLVGDCDRRIRNANGRVAAQMSSRTLLNLQDEIAELNKTLSALDQESDKLAAEGEVDKMMEIVSQVDALKQDKNEKEEELKKMLGNDATGAQGMRVCEVCGALLASEDSTDRRVADHFTGKMHVGYEKVRSALKSVRDQLRQHRPPSRAARSPPSRYDRRSRSRSRRRKPRDRTPDRRPRDRSSDRKPRDRSIDRRREYDRRREILEREMEYERELANLHSPEMPPDGYRYRENTKYRTGSDRSARSTHSSYNLSNTSSRYRSSDNKSSLRRGSDVHSPTEYSGRHSSVHSPTEFGARPVNESASKVHSEFRPPQGLTPASTGIGSADKEEGEL